VTRMTTSGNKNIKQILGIIQDTENSELSANNLPEGLGGISGLKTVSLLQRLARNLEKDSNVCYLEIGVFQGLTLVSTALEAPKLPCFGIDNFATLDPEGENESIVRERLEHFGANNATLIDADFEEALKGLGAYLKNYKVGIYFIDGPHDYRSQLMCLMLIKPFLHENAVIIVDDANYPDVRWSTKDFLLGHPEFKLLFDAYSPAHPANMTTMEKAKHELSWLNGIHVIVRDPNAQLPEMLPPTNEHERTIYLNEWLAHRLRMAELTPEALRLADAICSGNIAAAEIKRQKLESKYGDIKDKIELLFEDRNVFSKNLPLSRINSY
jgi:predicted O-methyltransferase YrrM